MPGNAIVEENRLLGAPSTEWDVNGWGDPSIQGFGHDISIDRGEAIHFKIKTDCPDYRIDIYRMGYYGGLGDRLCGRVRGHGASESGLSQHSRAPGNGRSFGKCLSSKSGNATYPGRVKRRSAGGLRRRLGSPVR